MRPKEIMVIAGEASGDLLAADLVTALRSELAAADVSYTPDAQPLRTGLEPRFFGAGGPRMKDAGVEIAVDLTEHSMIGLSGVVKHYFTFRRLFNELIHLALQRQPDLIICVDFSGFNRRFAAAIKRHVRSRRGWFHRWNPRIVQYVSPQVWASREGRAYEMARDYDLLLCILPFEKNWYAARVPRFPVQFVGNPITDRFKDAPFTRKSGVSSPPRVLLLPGSRTGELKRHLPVVLGALKLLRQRIPDIAARMILPSETLARFAREQAADGDVIIQAGGLSGALMESDVAIAKTGTITLECAWFRVPTVTFYKTSWVNYQIARRLVTVKTLTMPNLLAGEELFPEFVQDAATPEHIAEATLELLENQAKRDSLQSRLDEVNASLGPPGAGRRAARHIAALVRS